MTEGKIIRVNSAVKLTCDTEGVDGVISWYMWKFSNGTQILNATKQTMDYRIRATGKVDFICIAGNSFGTTSESQPVQIIVKNTSEYTKSGSSNAKR